MTVKSAAGQAIISTLQNDVAFLREIVKQQREDVEFYRGKVERLELAIMSNPPAQQEYTRTEVIVKPPISEVKLQQQPPPHLAFSDLKRKWNAMTQEEQEKAIQEGWNVDKIKEEVHEG